MEASLKVNNKRAFKSIISSSLSSKEALRILNEKLNCVDLIYSIKILEERVQYLLSKDPEYTELHQKKEVENFKSKDIQTVVNHSQELYKMES